MSEGFTILLVEDNPAHAELVARSLDEVSPGSRLVHVADGEAAIDYLKNRNENRVAPDLVLLDLRLPRMDGLEVLKQMKTDQGTARLPVVVLSTSAADSDVNSAYDFHANSYLVKPLAFDGFTALMEQVSRYWLDWNRLPTSNPV